MTLRSKQWGVLLKLAYKLLFRKRLAEVVRATDNPLGADVLEVLDSVAGYKK